MLGLADTVVTQITFSAYAGTGGGAASIAAPPPLVVISLLASGLAGLLFALEERRQARGFAALARFPDRFWRWVSATPSRLRVAWRHLLGRPRAASAAVRDTLSGARRTGIHLSARGWAGAGLLALALGISLGADIGAATPASRPAAQWAWIASVALLIVAALVLDGGSTRRKRSQRRYTEEADGEGEALYGMGRRGAGISQPTMPAAEQEVKLLSLNLRFLRYLRVEPRPPGVRIPWGWPDWLLLAILLAGALALRLPNLTGLPYVVHGDEAWCGLQALLWLNGGVPSLLSVGWYGLPVAGYGLPALVMHFAGANLWGLRLSSVIIGTLSIALLYALAREFTGRRVALLAAALLTVSHLHIQFSRMGIHYIHGMTAVLLVLWLLARALRRGSAAAAVLAAAAMSLSLQVYFSARIVFVIVPLFLLGMALFRRHAKVRVDVGHPLLKTVGWLALGLLVAVGPLAIYFQHDTGALTGRPEEVLILNLTSYRRQTLLSQFGTTDLRTILGRQLAAVPLIPGGLADQSLQYGPHYAMLDPLIAALVLIGFWYAVCTLRRPLALLLVVWVASVVTLGGVLTIDMPWWPRLLAMLPALCLLAALGLDALLRAVAGAAIGAPRVFKRLRWRWALSRGGGLARGAQVAQVALGAAVILAVVGFSLSQSLQHYYVQYPKSVNTDTYRTRYTDLAYYAATLPTWSHVILYDTGDLLLDYSTVQFLAPDLNGTLARTPAALRQALARALAKRPGPVIVIVPADDVTSFQQALAQLKTLPHGSFQAVRDAFGVTAFYTYTIP